jgi:hypothetical protein
MLFDCERHRRSGFARPDHEGPARRRKGKLTREDLERIGGGYSGLKALYEERLRFHARIFDFFCPG